MHGFVSTKQSHTVDLAGNKTFYEYRAGGSGQLKKSHTTIALSPVTTMTATTV